MTRVTQIDRRRREQHLIRQIKAVLQEMPGFEDDPARLSIAMLVFFFGDNPCLNLAEDHQRWPDLVSPFAGEPEYEAYYVCRVELSPSELAEAERRLVVRRQDYLGTVIRPRQA